MVPTQLTRPGKLIAGACLVAALGVGLSGPATAATQPPVAPSDLVAEDALNEGTVIYLSWVDNSYTETDPNNELGWQVERCTGLGCTDFALVQTVLNPYKFAVDTAPEENTTYSYRVRAFNDAGVSDWSNVDPATTSWNRPGQPSDLVGGYVNGTVELSWVDNATTETALVVERCEVAVCQLYESYATLPPDTTSFVDTNVLAGTAYDYRVRAYRATVFSGSTEVVTVATGDGPAAPTGLKATAVSTSSAQLGWRNRTRASRVQVWRCDGSTAACGDGALGWTELGESWSSLAVLPAGSQKYTDRGLATKTRYAYRIRAIAPGAVSTFVFTAATTR